MDALSQTLRVVHLVGAMFLQARFTAPWCYQSPRADVAAPLLEPQAERVIIFHLITEGECFVEMPDGATVPLMAGDVVVGAQSKSISELSQLKSALLTSKGSVSLDVVRQKSQITISVDAVTLR